MIIEFILAFIPILLSSALATAVSGGSFWGVLDIYDFLAVLLFFAILIILTGYGKGFSRVFFSKKKFENLNLKELRETDNSLKISSKILLYSATLFPIMYFIYILYTVWDQEGSIHSLGPNSAVLFLSVVYLCLFEMFIYMFKAKTRKAIILYMAEDEEKSEPAEKITISSVIKIIIGILFILGIIVFQILLMKAFSWNNWSSRSVLAPVIDFPSLLTGLIYVIPLVVISGNFKELLGGCKTMFTNKKIGVTKKNLYLNAVKTTMALNWFAGIATTIIGWIGMFYNLEDYEELYVNLALSLIPIFYTILFNLLLTIVEARINKVAE
jgi:hypothetical protein